MDKRNMARPTRSGANQSKGGGGDESNHHQLVPAMPCQLLRSMIQPAR